MTSKTFICISLVSLTLLACSENEQADAQFCQCIEATDNLNAVSSTMMDGDITLEKEQEVKDLRQKKDALCAKYATLSGEENRKKLELCAKK